MLNYKSYKMQYKVLDRMISPPDSVSETPVSEIRE